MAGSPPVEVGIAGWSPAVADGSCCTAEGGPCLRGEAATVSIRIWQAFDNGWISYLSWSRSAV